MTGFQQICRAIALPLAALMFLTALPLGMARAALVDTGRAVAEGTAAVAGDAERQRVLAFLQRDDVRRQLAELGVDPAEAAARVGGLSDGEVRDIAGHLDRLPAGQGAVGALIGAAVFVFLVLLLTDLLGLTDVFPFVRR